MPSASQSTSVAQSPKRLRVNTESREIRSGAAASPPTTTHVAKHPAKKSLPPHQGAHLSVADSSPPQAVAQARSSPVRFSHANAVSSTSSISSSSSKNHRNNNTADVNSEGDTGAPPPPRRSVVRRTLTVVMLPLVARWRILGTLLVVTSIVMLREEVSDVVLPDGLLVEDSNRPGLRFNRSASSVRHPVVLVPGFITTALEVWEGELCGGLGGVGGGGSFRLRMFSAQMILSILRDPACYLRHFSLDPKTGGDPPGIKVRPDASFSSADYLVFGFWVWAKLIVNLADIGYDPNSMYLAAYDWRLDPRLLESRDRYFSRLASHMEVMFPANHFQPYVMVGHSYGCIIIQEFLLWADEHRGEGWTNTHVHAVFAIGGPFLGLPKTVAGLTAGTVKDTALLPGPLRSLLDSHFERTTRTFAFRTWLCLTALAPVGGDCVWPHILTLTAPPGVAQNGTTFTATTTGDKNTTVHEMAGAATLEFMERHLRSSGHEATASAVAQKRRVYDAVPAFPRAPRTTVYCVYGVGLPSEATYWMTDANTNRSQSATADVATSTSSNATAAAMSYVSSPSSASLWIGGAEIPGVDMDVAVEKWSHRLYGQGSVRSGVGLVNGDGTVPLISLGYACRSKLHGFSRTVGRTVTFELGHEAPAVDLTLRGGVATADHVDIMGNYAVIEALLNVVTGRGDSVNDKVVSNIDALVDSVDTCRGG